MLIAGKMKAKDTAIYIVMQCIGAIIAAGVLLVIVTGQTGVTTSVTNLGQNGYDSHSPLHYSMLAALVAEVVLTMIFLLVIFGSTSKKAPAGFAGISIGLSLTMIHLVGIPITGTSVNPARSLGPALLVGGDAIGQLWLFWVAPIIGGIIAALVWRYVLEEKEAVPTA
jgi:aquaporin Z